MTTRASGTFEVKLTPQSTDGKSADAAIGRMSIDKQFLGDLKGTSKGLMLANVTDVKGSAVTSRWNRSTAHSMVARGLRPSA